MVARRGLDSHRFGGYRAGARWGVQGGVFKARLTPGHADVLRWVDGLPGPVAATYQAGPTGFGLYRALTAAGVRCQVAAPRKLQRPGGDRVKSDQRDAAHLARLLRLDEVTSPGRPSSCSWRAAIDNPYPIPAVHHSARRWTRFREHSSRKARAPLREHIS